MDYLFIKWIHIISATILFGTGIGTAFHMFMANRSRNTANIYFAARHVVFADWIFTAPSVVVQFMTGVWLAHALGLSFSSGWVFVALILFFFVGACWLPVVKMQIRMRDLAKHAYETKTPLPPPYWKLSLYWTILGSLAFPAMILIFYLMVFKPNW